MSKKTIGYNLDFKNSFADLFHKYGVKHFGFSFLVILAFFGCTAQGLDYRIVKKWNVDDMTPAREKTFTFISNSDAYFVFGTPAALLAAGLIKHDSTLKVAAINTAISLGVSIVATDVMKVIFKRPRPFVTYPDINKLSDGGGYSFPSGHTSSAFAVATSLVISFPKWYVAVPAYLYAGSVGISRVVLGVHYPSDVLAGAAVGILSAYGTHKATQWLQGKKNKRRAVANPAL